MFESFLIDSNAIGTDKNNAIISLTCRPKIAVSRGGSQIEMTGKFSSCSSKSERFGVRINRRICMGSLDSDRELFSQ